MKIIKRILCWLKFHKWETKITKDHGYVVSSGEQLFLVDVKCLRCGKLNEVSRLLFQKDSHE